MNVIHIDEDVASALAPILAAYGYQVRHARMMPGMAGITDPRQLLMAADAAATFVSHNVKDFRLLHDAWLRWSAAWVVARSHGGILIVPQGVSAPILGSAIQSLLESVPSVVDTCYVWHAMNGWRQNLVRP